MRDLTCGWAPALALAALTAGAAPARQGVFDPAFGLARAADADGDGEVTAKEWAAFVDGLDADAEGVVDRCRVKALLLGLDAVTTADLFDLFLLQDLALIDAKLSEFGRPTSPAPDPATRSEAELLASPDAAERDELERRFVLADEDVRLRICGAALSATRATQHPELVRLALRDPSAAVRRLGAETIARDPERAPLDALPAAFAVAGDEAGLRAALVAATRRAVEAAGDEERRAAAAFYERVFSTLCEPSTAVDPERWRLALACAPTVIESAPTADDRDATGELLDDLERALARAPDDVELWVQTAAARLRLARILMAAGSDPTFALQDVLGACREALERDPADGPALGYQAWASYLLSDLDGAGALAARALPRLAREAGSPLAVQVLSLFASVRTRELYAAIEAGSDWPARTIPDARASYEVLLRHPAGGEAHARAGVELLGRLRAYGAQADLLRRALARFPDSGDLHALLRAQVLRDAGARALEAAYEREPLASARASHAALIDWFHGLATLVAAEQDVRNRAPRSALEAYARCRARFQASADAQPAFAGSAAHYQCLALAGTARLLTAEGRHAEAVAALLDAARSAPQSFDAIDGLGRSPAAAVRELLDALGRAGAGELADRLEAGLSAAGVGR